MKIVPVNIFVAVLVVFVPMHWDYWICDWQWWAIIIPINIIYFVLKDLSFKYESNNG